MKKTLVTMIALGVVAIAPMAMAEGMKSHSKKMHTTSPTVPVSASSVNPSAGPAGDAVVNPANTERQTDGSSLTGGRGTPTSTPTGNEASPNNTLRRGTGNTGY